MCFQVWYLRLHAYLSWCKMLTYIGWEKMAAIFLTAFLDGCFFNENVWISIKFSLQIIPNGPIINIPALVQTMAWRWLGDKPLSEALMVSFLNQPQWVKTSVIDKYGMIISNFLSLPTVPYTIPAERIPYYGRVHAKFISVKISWLLATHFISIMMMPWHGRTFHITGPLWGKPPRLVDYPHKCLVMLILTMYLMSE